ncbi:uncharacterized protein LOC132048869 [Lycium ferocissimum]|uniref:uncharacterized protein LOC132048869 n=1 Tax=Lycium ferocissimum TaxID=112874 RepID=UPI0028168945|nr:uncharacterized protein LOC132048869 [Lycium ferocissimum]
MHYAILWNLCNKKDKLWVRWVHLYCIKEGVIEEATINQAAWIIRKIVKARTYIEAAGLNIEEEMKVKSFSIRQMYLKLLGPLPKVNWRRLICSNPYPPKCLFMVFLVVNGKIYTKNRLIKWGMDVGPLRQLCNRADESLNHLFFTCPVAAEMWGKLLQ